MATPDPSTLTSSKEIFSANHTLPQIRNIHKSIHVQIEEKATRLRTQVGNSYRELLGTADNIVRMRSENDDVQTLLGQMGGRCGRGVVKTKATGLADFIAKDERPEATSAARLKLLDACLLVCGRVLNGGGGVPEKLQLGDRMVLASKIYVLSRLLVKSIGEDVPDKRLRHTAQSANKTLGSLRFRLQGGIKRVLESTNDDDVSRTDVLNALCAYSLATSSGASDALRYFLSVREEAMTMAFETEEGERDTGTEDVIQGLKLYTRTILDVQAVVPSQLAPALMALKQRPTLTDDALKQLEGLRLDLFNIWCGEDIQYFTPYLRHDDLDAKQARDWLSTWAKNGAEVLINGLRKTLSQMTDFKSIVELRTSVLQLWIRDGGKAKGFDPLEMQDDLRAAINARLLAVLVSKVSKLRLVGSEVKATLESWESGVMDKHKALWAEAGYEDALSQGAAAFIQEVVSRLYGRNDAVSRVLNSYSSWYLVIDDVKEVVEMLQKQRWDNDYEEIEEEETIDARQQLLSKDDPKTLYDRLNSALDKAFRELQDHLQKLWEERSQVPSSSAIAIYLLRVLRDIRNKLPDRPSIQSFGLSMVPSLHEKVSAQVSAPALDEYVHTGLAERHVVSRLLWEGEPQLPNQPSPALFQFLRTLSMSMSDVGVDLWTPRAVAVLKSHVETRQKEMWHATLTNISSEQKDLNPESEEKEETGEGSGTSAATEVDLRDLYVQWFFDATLLKVILGNSAEAANNGLDSVMEELYSRAGLSGDTPRQNMSKAAQDFWHRTGLLFGLLA